MVIGYSGVLQVEEDFTNALEGIIRSWGVNHNWLNHSRFMVILRGISKGNEGKRWHMLLLVKITSSVIEVRKWGGRKSQEST